MKKNFLLLLLSLLISSTGFSMEEVACPGCNDLGNNITQTSGTTFSATTAQAYYWEICQGNASISGSRTGKNVTVNCSGSYTIKVTRFVGGNCIEACQEATCGTPPPTCPSASNMFFFNEAGGGLCATGLAGIIGLSNVNYVNWTWALGGYSGTINNAGTTTPIYYPSGNWDNYFLVVCATVVFNNGTVCPKICRSFLLDCGDGFPNYNVGTIFPNPSTGEIFVDSDYDSDISQISVVNAQGRTVRTLQGENVRDIDLSNESNGIYFFNIRYADGHSKVEKVVLEK